MFRFLAFSMIFALAFAKSRFSRQIDESQNEGSGLQFIQFDQNSNFGNSENENEGSGLQFIQFDQNPNPITSEGSGLLYDEEGSGNQLLFDSPATLILNNGTESESENLTENGSQKIFSQSINITDSDVETLQLTVHLPQKTTTQLLDDLKDDTNQQTNPIHSLDTAVSLTNVLNELLGRLQDSTMQ